MVICLSFSSGETSSSTLALCYYCTFIWWCMTWYSSSQSICWLYVTIVLSLLMVSGLVQFLLLVGGVQLGTVPLVSWWCLTWHCCTFYCTLLSSLKLCWLHVITISSFDGIWHSSVLSLVIIIIQRGTSVTLNFFSFISPIMFV